MRTASQRTRLSIAWSSTVSSAWVTAVSVIETAICYRVDTGLTACLFLENKIPLVSVILKPNLMDFSDRSPSSFALYRSWAEPFSALHFPLGPAYFSPGIDDSVPESLLVSIDPAGQNQEQQLPGFEHEVHN